MAASADPSQMLQFWKEQFPLVPDSVIWRVMTQNPKDHHACRNALQTEQHLRWAGGFHQGTVTTSAVDLRHNGNGMPQRQSPPQKHRYSEPNVVYQRNVSEASIHLEPQQRPVSAPPDKSTFIVQYPYTPTPTYYPPYHNRSAPAPVRSYSTTANFMMNQSDRHSPIPRSELPPRYAPYDNQQFNTNSTSQPRENTVVTTMQYRPTNLPVTPTSGRTSAVLKHANTSPMLGRQLFQGNQAKEILMTSPNDHKLGTPAPIKPMISPASSLSSLTDSPEVKPDMNQPPLPITKEQEEYAYTQALLLHQRMRYERLNKDYEEEKEVLEKLKHEVESMEKQLLEKRANKSTHSCTAKTITRLSEENRQLAIDIECMTREIELHKNQAKYQEGFYENIGYTGAPGPVPAGHPDPRAIVPHCKVPSVHEDEDGYLLVMEADEDQQWSCRACTFLNHPALSKCETCDSPRL